MTMETDVVESTTACVALITRPNCSTIRQRNN